MIERSQKAFLAKRLEEEPRRFIQVIAGPRRVGNSGIPWQEFMQIDPLELFR